jgi:hypothetical protein
MERLPSIQKLVNISSYYSLGCPLYRTWLHIRTFTNAGRRNSRSVLNKHVCILTSASNKLKTILF